ncbi:aldo/keto reductase [Alteromonas confluentis]|uniref:Aldo/keto reductase n=1 Tax=Alteromonas confluentis TaxID=1656094 RepID=A0A1E7Z6R2_9ALTE|nr:aldo/keto reductase [Alteromonas confluentis]OFC69111.1 aldo/keto reductase [Alteromonas confluentis]
MKQRVLAGKSVSEIGLGCMNLNHAYGDSVSQQQASSLLASAFEQGITHFDTAALYGFGENEKLVGEAIKGFRNEIFLASKCGMTGVNGKRVIDGRPETLVKTLDTALQSLQVEQIDLYYLHRIDKDVPLEESVGVLGDMVKAGKIAAVGLSEVSAESLRRAHKEYPIAALQTEYSLWTRNAEIAVLEACKDLGIDFVAFSPLARGYLAGGIDDPAALAEGDIRKGMPRFQGENWIANKSLYAEFADLAKNNGVTPAQLAIAWVLAQGEHIHALPGTKSETHLTEDIGASDADIAESVLAHADDIINRQSVQGARYGAGAQADIDTEDF